MSDLAGAVRVGYADRSHAAQQVFRATMWAMARPGCIDQLPVSGAVPAPLAAGAAALLLALADYETPVWLDDTLANTAEVGELIRFHTGAPITVDPSESMIAVVAEPARMPPLAAFQQGTLEYPDRSTTVILQMDQLGTDGFWLEGPGIDGRRRLAAAPLPGDFLAQWAENGAAYPCGVDVLLVAGERVAALPRSTHIVGG